jgi:hypothetical protein
MTSHHFLQKFLANKLTTSLPERDVNVGQVSTQGKLPRLKVAKKINPIQNTVSFKGY